MNNPLIIERPECQGWGRRLVLGTLTLGLWLGWLYLLLPVFKPLLVMAGVDPASLGIAVEDVSIQPFALVLSLVAAILIGFWLWSRYNMLLHRFRARRQTQGERVGLFALAESFGINPADLTDWHRSGQLLIRLTDEGAIHSIAAGEQRVYSFAESCPANEPLLQKDVPQDEPLIVSKAS